MKPLKVLVVQRDATRRSELVELLGRAEYRTVAAASAAAAAEAIAEAEFDCIVLDLSLPDLDLPTLQRALLPTAGEPDSLDAAERRHLAHALRHTGGNKRKAAHLLGIARSTLLNKVRKYGLDTD